MNIFVPLFFISVVIFCSWMWNKTGTLAERSRWVRAQIAASNDPSLTPEQQYAILFFRPNKYEVKK